MPLPTFIIGGERRCGTTSLYYWIKDHPEVYLYPAPDMTYFIEEEITGTRTWRDGETDAARWERTHDIETYASLFRPAAQHRGIGQKDADLLYWQPAHPRLARFLPECKFIITLRDPVTRARSQYWNEVGKGRENLSFEEAIEAEEERCRTSAYARNHLAYLRRGYYEESLKSFFRYVPPNRVFITTQEECQLRPREVLREIFRFLGVSPDHQGEAAGKVYNPNRTMLRRRAASSGPLAAFANVYERLTEAVIVRMTEDAERRRAARRVLRAPFRTPAAGMSMKEETRRKLERVYAPHIEALEELLNRSFSAWKPQ